MARIRIFYDPDTKIIKAIEGDVGMLDQSKIIGQKFTNLNDLKTLIKRARVKKLEEIEVEMGGW